MLKKENATLQEISWVKSDILLTKSKSIKRLYYPETIDELIQLISDMLKSGMPFDIIGYSSNTLFRPSYSVEHLICTKKLKTYTEEGNLIICDCGVPVSSLSKTMVSKGYKGFEGLTDLPGTIAAAVYGNCGCRGCSINALLHHIELLTNDGRCVNLTKEDLSLSYRTTSLKNKNIKGVILRVYLNIVHGDSEKLKHIASINHEYRKKTQPTALNNLGTTFNGGNHLTVKGVFFKIVQLIVRFLSKNKDARVVYPKVLKLFGKSKFIPYIYYWNRYMFLDAKAHDLFDEYYEFLRTLFKDVRLEIEIRK